MMDGFFWINTSNWEGKQTVKKHDEFDGVLLGQHVHRQKDRLAGIVWWVYMQFLVCEQDWWAKWYQQTNCWTRRSRQRRKLPASPKSLSHFARKLSIQVSVFISLFFLFLLFFFWQEVCWVFKSFTVYALLNIMSTLKLPSMRRKTNCQGHNVKCVQMWLKWGLHICS